RRASGGFYGAPQLRRLRGSLWRSLAARCYACVVFTNPPSWSSRDDSHGPHEDRPVPAVTRADSVSRESHARAGRWWRATVRQRVQDLEDCYSQATLELLASARRGARFACDEHIARTLELRFGARVTDRCRQIAGRSRMEAAVAHALPLDKPLVGVPQANGTL